MSRGVKVWIYAHFLFLAGISIGFLHVRIWIQCLDNYDPFATDLVNSFN